MTRALDVLLPPSCAACGEGADRHGLLCAGCFAATRFIAAPLCDRCGRPGAFCADCTENPPVFERARAAMVYDEGARKLVLPFKHADRVEVAHTLAALMATAGRALLAGCDALVPVPLHAARLRRRRYNQAALLAVALARASERPVLRDALWRVRKTPVLGRMPGPARRRALVGVIAVRPGTERHIAGRRIVLVDDVMTSGATADACADALFAAGAAGVDVVLAARTAAGDAHATDGGLDGGGLDGGGRPDPLDP